MLDALCPGCGKTWKVPVAGKKYPCRVCGADVVAAVKLPEAALDEATAAPVTTAAPGSGPPPLPNRRSQVNEFRLKYAAREHKARSKASVHWLLGIGILFVIGGVFVGIMAGREADKALELLAEHEPDEMLDVPGRSQPVRVSALMDEVRSESLRVWVIHGVLAASFIGLSFWARKAPLPAAITGLCIYLVLLVVNLIVDPATLLQGVVIKGLFIAAMVKTITSAMTERTLMKAAQRDAAPESAPAT